jgi:hypothetical protein
LDNLFKTPNIYGFAFGHSYLLYQLKQIDCCYLLFGEASIDKYMEFLLHDQPRYILGIGKYHQSDKSNILITQTCSNYTKGNYDDSTNLIEKAIPNFLQQNSYMDFNNSSDESWQNYSCYEITKLIESKKLNAEFTFLQIPRQVKPWIAQKQIDEVLFDFRSTKGLISRCE